MLCVKITDGLGNQLFQYAVGKSISIKKHTDLYIDKSWYQKDTGEFTKRNFSLTLFNAKYQEANTKQIKSIINPKLPFGIRSIYWRIQNTLPYFKKKWVKEKAKSFDPNIFKCKKNAYLQGFWQTEKYFVDIRDQLLKDLTLAKPIDNNPYKNSIESSDSPVSIHIRRGDYIKETSEHITLDLAYYAKSIEHIRSKVSSPSFFLFTDDPDWVKENNLFSSNKEYTLVEGQNPEIDLTLMSKCDHNIIANSSFSWWGAWLNQNPEKIVVAPKLWFKNPDIDTSDLIPEKWLRL